MPFSSGIYQVLIVTGDLSADLHASLLVKALLKINPDLDITAVASEKTKIAGATVIKDLTKKSSIGFIEAVKVIPVLYKLKGQLIKLMKDKKVDLLICMDYQGFNMILTKQAQKYNIPVAYYIPPQEWAWGSEKGMLDIVNNVDKIIGICQQEHDAYKKYTDNVRFYGNPLIDVINEFHANQEKPLIKEANLISIFPGSRKQEIKYIFPEMIEVIKHLKTNNNRLKFVINLANYYYLNDIGLALKKSNLDIPIFMGKTHETLARSKYAIVTSGTISLEASLMTVPHVVLYKFNPISYKLIKRVLNKKFKLQYFSPSNIVVEKEVVKEYMQNFKASVVAEHISSQMIDPVKYQSAIAEIRKVQQALRGDYTGSVVEAVARYILAG